MSRAVVLGAGIGGLAAAAALKDSFEEVLIVDRDPLPPGPELRKGVPQGKQLHNLLVTAQIHLDSLLPGFLNRLLENGAVAARVSTDTYVHELGMRMPERDLQLQLISAPRPAIEYVARELLSEDPRVGVVDGTTALSLRLRQAQVTGVFVQADGAEPREIPASLVVDALGAGSPVSKWLAQSDVVVPEEQLVVDQWYSTTLFHMPRDMYGTRRYWLLFPSETCSRGGLASPIDQEHLYVSLNGAAADTPPLDSSSYVSYAETLADPELAQVLSRCTPVSDSRLYRKPIARWRHYEAIRSPVMGLLPLGDAFATLNPLFGQGMSVAALQARALADILHEYGPDPRGVTPRYLAEGADRIQQAWDLGAVVDRSETSSGSPGEDFSLALGELIWEDAAFHKAYVRMWHLLDSATLLQKPSVRRRIQERVESRRRQGHLSVALAAAPQPDVSTE